jgi:hypothetical protein
MLPGLLLRVPAAVPPPEAGMAKVKKAGKESEAHDVVRVWSIDYSNNPQNLASPLSADDGLYRQLVTGYHSTAASTQLQAVPPTVTPSMRRVG